MNVNGINEWTLAVLMNERYRYIEYSPHLSYSLKLHYNI